MRRGLCTIALLLSTACGGSSPTEPAMVSLRFTPRAAELGSGETATVESGQGQIAVRATLTGPDPCRTLSGEIERRERDLTLRVSIRPNGSGGCVTVIGGFAYDAAIERLAAGRYNLQVVHTYPATGWPTRTVVSQTVDVR